jgi:hypothetical protein
MGGFGVIALSRKCDLTLCKSVEVELSTNAHGGTLVTWDSALDFLLANSTTAYGRKSITAFFAFGIDKVKIVPTQNDRIAPDL